MNSGMKTFVKRYRAWANKDEDNSEELEDTDEEDIEGMHIDMPPIDTADDMELDQ